MSDKSDLQHNRKRPAPRAVPDEFTDADCDHLVGYLHGFLDVGSRLARHSDIKADEWYISQLEVKFRFCPECGSFLVGVIDGWLEGEAQAAGAQGTI